METMMNLTEMSPAQIDELLAAIRSRRDQAWAKAYDARKHAKSPLKAAKPGATELAAEAERVATAADDLVTQAMAEAKPYEDEFRRRGGWARYYQVCGKDGRTEGHVHREMNCHT